MRSCYNDIKDFGVIKIKLRNYLDRQRYNKKCFVNGNWYKI